MKKRILTIIAACVLVATFTTFALIYLNNSESLSTAPSGKQSASMGQTSKKNGSKNGTKKGTHSDEQRTLLIYMIGSDLESRSGAGTEDLVELENSGIDTDSVNVVVYAGGSPHWHNDNLAKENNTILHLTNKGFEAVAAMPSSSMGTSESLLEFLNYAVKNYPADSYSLVMWNHGNGPVIGYGKDMLFDNDSLTLSEMRAALSASPFGHQNKLEWVGFDACLMASAELTCLWDDYAKYLVASQEVEPSFGWNYDVFGSFGTTSTESFLSTLVDGYMTACNEYYEKKGYENRDTTLACINLSNAAELERTVNALFTKASSDIGSNYNTLARKRVSTRALGRASTGSEYDLIDLNDMASQLEDVYPDEASALKTALGNMVLKNNTNTTGCCGMSIYYPFYNKYHYEKSWRDIYSELAIFPSYGEYLSKYQETWLSDDNLDQYEQSPTPQKVGELSNKSNEIAGTYMLPLSPKQQESFADAKIYILQKNASSLYHPMISSENVVNRDGILYADFNGKAIHIEDNFGFRILPGIEEHDTVGDTTRYSVIASGRKFLTDETAALDIQLALNNKTEELTTTAVLPYRKQTKSNELVGGKSDEYDLNDWDMFTVLFFNHKNLTRYENGLVRPLDKWLGRGQITGYEMLRKDGFNFVYAPLEGDNYYLIFEITDTQGNKYCSEMLQISPPADDSDEATTVSAKTLNIDWTSGTEVEILNEYGVSVKLNSAYELIATNSNDFNVDVKLDDIVFNGNIYVQTSIFSIPAKSQAKSQLSFYYREAVEMSALKQIDKIVGYATISGDNETLLNRAKVWVNIAPDVERIKLAQKYTPITSADPFLGASADKQILHEDDDVRITLMNFGKFSDFDEGCYVLYENLSDVPLRIAPNGVEINGHTVETSGQLLTLPVGCVKYDFIDIHQSSITGQGILGIETLKTCFDISRWENHNFFEIPDKHLWLPVALKESVKALMQPTSDGRVIYDKNNIRITVTDYRINLSTDSSALWYVTVENNNDFGIQIYTTDAEDNLSVLNGISSDNGQVGPNQKHNTTFKYQSPALSSLPKEVPMKIHIMDYWFDELLYYAEEPVIMLAENKDSLRQIQMNSAEGVKLTQCNGVSVYLKKGVNSENHPCYLLEAENASNIPVTVDFDVKTINGNIVTNNIFDYSLSVKSEPGTTTTANDELDFKKEFSLGLIDKVDSIEGQLSIRTDSSLYYIKEQPVRIVISGDAVIGFADSGYQELTLKPTLGALAEKQVLWENENLRLGLLFFGENNYSDSYAWLYCENLSSEIQNLRVPFVAVNGTTLGYGCDFKLNPGTMEYKNLYINNSLLKDNGITSIESIDLDIAAYQASRNNAETARVSAVLRESGNPAPYISGDNIVFDKNGVKIIVDDFTYELGSYEMSSTTGIEPIPTWHLTVINDTDKNISLGNATDKNFSYSFNLSQDSVGAHQRIHCKITPSQRLTNDALSFILCWDEYLGDRLFTDTEPIFLYVEDETFNVAPFMDALAEEQVLFENENIRIKLICFGKNEEENGELYLYAENLTSSKQSVLLNLYCINGKTYGNGVESLHMNAYDKTYAKIQLNKAALNEERIDSIESISCLLELYPGVSYVGFSDTPAESVWVPITLTKAGNPEPYVPGDAEIYNKDGVKIVLDGYELDSEAQKATWNITAINDSDEYVSVLMVYHGESASSFIRGCEVFVAPHQYAHTTAKSATALTTGKCPLRLWFGGKDSLPDFQHDEIFTLYVNDGTKITKEKISTDSEK